MSAAAQKSGLRGRLRKNEMLSRYTSWRVGGPADRFYHPADRDDLVIFLQSLAVDEPLFFMGLGSNLLIRDGGIRGTVVNLRGCLNRLECVSGEQSEPLIYAEAGVNSSQLARFAVNQGFTGSEFLAGIPGTVGGALAMNAGCYGSETWQFVKKVETIVKQGQLIERYPQEFRIAYRSVQGPHDEWFVACWFRFEKPVGSDDGGRIRELLEKRSHAQPVGSYSCGSVFRNPEGDYAAQLIERCGLKGYRIGGAHVSDKHANFILNDDRATAADIEHLIEHVHAVVAEKTGVQLTREVQIVGEPA